MNEPLTFNNMRPFPGIDPLNIEGIRKHVIEAETNRELILTEEESIYPENAPVSLQEIMLGKLGVAQFMDTEVEVFVLPQDYVWLGSVINDATSSESERAKTFLDGIFYEIGHSIRKIYDSSAHIPQDLSYNDIVIERDIIGFKLLPPVEFMPTDETDAPLLLGEVLLNEMLEQASNERQREAISIAFEGYKRAAG